MLFPTILLCLSSLATAFPLVTRDILVVWNPPITAPSAGVVWKAESKQTVTWDTSTIPPTDQLTRPDGTILLGYDTGDSLNLMVDEPLAKGFNLTDGKVEITIPIVPTRSDYIVVVFGDSGNASPKFTIQGIRQPIAATSSSSSLITEPIPITGPNVSIPSATFPTSVPVTITTTTSTDSAPITSSSSSAPTATSTSPPITPSPSPSISTPLSTTSSRLSTTLTSPSASSSPNSASSARWSKAAIYAAIPVAIFVLV